MNNPTDTVFIKGLRTEAVIGVYDWEQQITQPLIVDVVMHTNLNRAIASDCLDDAVDYAKVSECIRQWVTGSRFALIESLAGYLIECLLQQFTVDKVTLTIYKPEAVTYADTVGITLTRHR